MTIPLHRKSKNIELSILKFIREQFTEPNSLQAYVTCGDSEFDASGKEKWVDVMFLNSGAGKRSVTVVQVDFYTRTDIDDGDRYGDECERLERLFYEAMHVDAIQLYDFTADPASPASLTSRRVMVRRSDGTFREPDEEVVWPIEDGIARRTLTYHFQLPDDLAGDRYYDD